MTKMQRDRKNFYAAIAARLGAGVPAEQIGHVDYSSPLAAAKRAAKRIFGWQRLYATPWYPMADMTSDGEDEIYMAAWDQERHHDTPPDLTPRRVVLEALED